MATKVFNPAESTSINQKLTFTIPGLVSVSSVSVNTGTVSLVKVEGDKVTVNCSGGTYSRRVQTGGSIKPGPSKSVTKEVSTSLGDYDQDWTPPNTYYYNEGGYKGTIYLDRYDCGRTKPGYPDICSRIDAYYSGTVTGPDEDTRTWQYYYKYTVTINYIANTPPTISGQDQDLGDKNLGFVITYQVNDVDTSDSLIVTEKLNGSIIRNINGAPRNQDLEIEITNETLFSLPLNSTNTIEIKVDDQNGSIAYRRYTFRRTNTAPIISGNDEDLGQKIEPFSIDFSASDNEGNAITVRTYLDGVQKEEYQAEDGAINAFTISQDDWFKLPIGTHLIKIEAIDEHGATAVRNYTFTRYDDKIQFTLKNPIETDIMANKILVTPTWYIPEGATAIVEACNNGFDEIPTWEDITSQVLINRHYNFTNDTKTAEKWGINIRFTIEKGTATEKCVINGFGGAFE